MYAVINTAGHSASIRALKFIDPHTLISASDDQTIRIWNLDTCTTNQVLPRPHNNKIAALAVYQSKFASASIEGNICTWKKQTSLAQHAQEVEESRKRKYSDDEEPGTSKKHQSMNPLETQL